MVAACEHGRVAARFPDRNVLGEDRPTGYDAATRKKGAGLSPRSWVQDTTVMRTS